MRTRILLRFFLVVLPTAGLMLLWLAFLPRQGQASSVAAILPPAGEKAPTQVPTPASTPDSRWVELVRAQGAGDGAAPDASLPTINLNLADQYAAGRVPSPVVVNIAILDQDQELFSVDINPVPDGSGFFYLANLGGGEDTLLQPGYELRLTQVSTVVSLTIPTLTSLAYPQTDILSGTAPASAALLAYLFPYASPSEVFTDTTTSGSDGAYQLDWAPGIDLRPRDNGYLIYTQDAFRMVYQRFVAPFLQLHVGGSDLFGYAAPNNYVEIYVEDAAGTYLGQFTRDAGHDGYFNLADCYDSEYGGGLVFAPSDRVIIQAGGQTFSMTVINVTAHADSQAGQVWGQAPAGQPVEVEQFGGPLGEWSGCIWMEQPLSRQIVTATAEGGYAAGLPLQAGNYGAALASTPDGNQVYTRFAVPYLHVTLGRQEYYPTMPLWGQVAESSAPITVEIQGPSGYLKDWFTLTSYNTGYFTDEKYYNLVLSLESGDLLTLTTPHEAPMSLLLPELTAAADVTTDIVSGQAPPSSQVYVKIFSYPVMALTVTADTQGQYSADFSALGGLDGYMSGEVVWTSPQGYHVLRSFSVEPVQENICPPRLYSAQVGGNELYLGVSHDCLNFTLRLWDSGGELKWESVVSQYQMHFQLYDASQRPVLILPGDHLEIISGATSEITEIPVLTVNLDPQAEQAYGQAPPGAEITIQSGYGWEYVTGTVSEQGTYAIDLAGIIDLDAGSYVRASLPGLPSYYAVGVVPDLETWLYHPQVHGRLEPLTPLTLTESTPLTTTAPITGYAGWDGEYGQNVYPAPEGAYHGLPGESVQVETPSRLWQLTLPYLTARVDASAGIVNGQAPPDSRLGIELYTWDGLNFQTVVTATASGTFSATFPIPSGSQYITGILTHFTAFDIRTYLNFYTPSWHVTLGTGWVDGYIPVPGAPFTVTLQSGDGSFSQAITGTSYSNSFWFEFDRLIQPGDRLYLYSLDGLVGEYTVPRLTAVHDYARRALEGWSPTGGDLVAYFPGPDSTIRHVRIGPNGRYGVDTSDLDLPMGDEGFVTFTDPHGNTVRCPFIIRGYQVFFPLAWKVDVAP